MLKRRPIRIKLIVALTLLSAIVSLLASSGIWGLYRYRRLADEVSQRAVEIPHANDLNRLALELQASFERSNKLRGHERARMIELGDTMFDLRDDEDARFDHALTSFDIELQFYQDIVSDTESNQTLMIDNVRQRRNLGEIRELYSDLEDKWRRRSINMSHVVRQAELTATLASLVEHTETHLTMIHETMEQFSDDVSGQYRAWIIMAWSCTVLALLMVALLLWSFRSLVVKPFRTLLDGSRLVAGGQFDHRIDLGTGDELSELADAMNGMTDRFQGALAKVNSWCTDLDRQVQQRTREVIQNEQLASVGFLAAGVAHEINNPLATIAWSAESLQSRVAEIAMLSGDQRVVDDELCEALTTNLRRIEEEAYRCKGITEKLLDFSRLNEVRRTTTDLLGLAQDVVEMVGKVGKYRCKTLRIHGDHPVEAEVNQQEIRQVVLNLVTNALESVSCDDGAVDVYVNSDDTFASVIVKDDGCGMSSEVLQHLFEPFFTRRQDGTGTGLGLSITYRIVSQHGGSLIAQSDGEGRGAQMEMVLPLSVDATNINLSRQTTLGLNHESHQGK